MHLSSLLPLNNDNSKYRFHLAKQEPTGTKPIDVLTRSKEEWSSWQHYRGGRKERFITDGIVSFAQISDNKFLSGGVFKITSRNEAQIQLASAIGNGKGQSL